MPTVEIKRSMTGFWVESGTRFQIAKVVNSVEYKPLSILSEKQVSELIIAGWKITATT